MKKKILLLFSSKYIKRIFAYSVNHRVELLKLLLLDIFMPLLSIISILIFKSAVDNAINLNQGKLIFNVSIYALIMFLSIIIRARVSYLRIMITNKMNNSFQTDFLKTFYKMKWKETINYRTGDIVTRITKDISSIINLYTSIIPSFFSLIIESIVSLIIVMYFELYLGLLVILLAPLLIVASSFLSRKIKPYQNKLNDIEGNYRSHLNEAIHNSVIVRAFQKEQHMVNSTEIIQEKKLYLNLKKGLIIINANMIIQLGYALTKILGVIWGIYKMSSNQLTFGEFLAFTQLISRIQNPIFMLSKLIPQYVNVVSAIDRVDGFLTKKVSLLVDSSIINDNYGIKILNLSFSYSNNQTVIRNFSTVINPGEKVAITGSSGIGKTTLMRLIMNLLDPDYGTIQVFNGDKIINNKPDYYTYVPQGNTLFTGSIRSNLTFNNSEISDEEIHKALTVACAKDFVMNLDNQLDSNLGENGVGLSEGQLQRLCIARAFLRNSSILLLDEATSALDIKTEELLIKNIKKYYPNKTLIAITHRPSILSIVNREINLDFNSNNEKAHNNIS